MWRGRLTREKFFATDERGLYGLLTCMYGLSNTAAKDLSFIIGKEICQVAIGSFDVQFNWGNGGISVWCRFIYTPSGTSPITWTGSEPEVAAKAVRLLNATVMTIECDQSLRLTFSNGDHLEVFEDSRYESFSIQNGKNPTIIV